MFVLCHNLLGMNRLGGWVGTDQKWVRNVRAWVRIIWVRNNRIPQLEIIENSQRSSCVTTLIYASKLINKSHSVA